VSVFAKSWLSAKVVGDGLVDVRQGMLYYIVDSSSHSSANVVLKVRLSLILRQRAVVTSSPFTPHATIGDDLQDLCRRRMNTARYVHILAFKERSDGGMTG
jgi:hypothetical protein